MERNIKRHIRQNQPLPMWEHYLDLDSTKWPKNFKNCFLTFITQLGFPSGSDDKKKKIACNAGDLGLIPGSGRYHGKGNGYPFQYSFLENYMDREAWWAMSMGSQRFRHDWLTNTSLHETIRNSTRFSIWWHFKILFILIGG